MPPLASLSSRNREHSYDERAVMKNMKDLLSVMGFRTGVTVREVNVRYRFLAKQFHPDKHDSQVTSMTTEEATEIFKLVNNAKQFLRVKISA